MLLVAILTLGITTTNAVWGLLMLAATMSRRRALLTAGAAFSLVWILWYMRPAFFPTSDSFLKLNTPSELMYIMNPDSLGLLAKLRAFAFHSIVLPEIELVYGFRLSVQGSRVLQDSLVGTIALLAWISLLALAVSAIRKIGTSLTLKVLDLGTLSQAVLAASFGVETFSYSANWTTALVLLVGLLAIKRSSRGGASILDPARTVGRRPQRRSLPRRDRDAPGAVSN